MRKVVFFGNCQASTMCSVYESGLAPLMEDEARFVSCFDASAEAREDGARHLAEADVIMAQQFDTGQKVELDVEEARAEVIRFPTVSLASLWPFGGVAHVHNQPQDYWSCGPYDYLMGDNFLNRLLRQGVAPDDAVARYLDADIPSLTHLDRLHELVMARQRSRDAASGMAFADEIEAHFRAEPVFLNHYHPGTRVARAMARQMFGALGAPPDRIEQLVGRWRRTPFERSALPIHPKVAAHFGLLYGHAGERYLYHTGEMLTFEEFARRYAAFQWNEALLRGVATFHWGGSRVYGAFRGDVAPETIEACVQDLRRGLQDSRGSGLGERALAQLSIRQGRGEVAAAALERAVRFDPSDAEALSELGRLREARGELAAAEAAFRAAITQAPDLQDPYFGLARVLRAQGRDDEALPVLRQVVDVAPGNGFGWFDLAVLLLESGRKTNAEAAFGMSARHLPGDPLPRIRLACCMAERGEADAAEAALVQAERCPPGPPGVAAELVSVRALIAGIRASARQGGMRAALSAAAVPDG